jgi:DNA-directed RNA polymerase specialized sigma24 family protein
MAIAADWEERFQKLVRVSPPDVAAVWALIVECMEDDEQLSHTFNAVLKMHRAPHEWRRDLRQDLAERLAETIGACPNLNLNRRLPAVSPARWFYGVVDNLCKELLKQKWTNERRNGNGTAERVGDDSTISPDAAAASHSVAFERACELQRASADAEDAALDVQAFLNECDDWTRNVLVAYLGDLRVRNVEKELGVAHATAWRAVNEALSRLRERMEAYR